ncbi:molybdenum cofactor guanylyltransferase MobA [Staphylococcus hominis]|uniref:molybdenum cofactor guanylyltransferase MobA n=1 Tax=Staphylococcus hominis TaxID=1290 RepID=UPI00287AD33D|nr:molybdenum cofactor guanylyltransferase MobA [Staphylococcus hominis]MDS3839778.1 molybdenum cofactor guanylyltransferase MobA [Staphylococcus hominis]
MKAIILAGGHSKRFGSPKAFACIHGEMFYKRIINTLTETNLFDDIIISTNKQLKNEFEYKQIMIDEETHADKGPLSGIYTVMKHYNNEELFFVVSVDTPMITKEAISQLYQFTISQRMEHQADIIAYSDNDKPIPTIAFYSRGVISNIEKALNSNDYSLRHVYKNVITCFLDTKEVQLLKNWSKNINYQDDLNTLLHQIND